MKARSALHPRSRRRARQSNNAQPLCCVVFLQAAPGEPPFALLGKNAEAGQTLSVIEAMKVVSEVQDVRDGIVDAFLVTSGQDVRVGSRWFGCADCAKVAARDRTCISVGRQGMPSSGRQALRPTSRRGLSRVHLEWRPS